MTNLRAAMLLATVALSSLFSHGAALGQPQARARIVLAPLDEEVIVGFKPEAATLRKHALSARSDAATAAAALADRASTLGQRVGRSLQSGAATGAHSQVVRAAGVDATTLARQLAADPDVAYAVPNGRKRAYAAPNDPLYAAATRTNGPDSGQWYLRAPDNTIKSAIDIETAWARTNGSAGIVVAVLDTGVRFDHPDLGRVAVGGRLLPGYDFVSNATVANDGGGRDADPSDPGDWVTSAETSTSTFSGCTAEGSSWHGTSTASLVAAAANNGVGMAGAAPGVLVQPVRVLGKCYGTDSDIQAAMRWAAGIGVPGVPDNPTPAKVINMSLGGGSTCSASYQAVVNEIVARGAVIVAAAGNSAGGPVGEPASCSGVIGVLALRHAGTKVGFSDLGPEIAVSAPGGNCVNTAANTPCLYPILAASNTGTQGPASSTWSDSYNITVGTSFASPITAGVAALILSADPSLSVARVRNALQGPARAFPQTGADNGTDTTAVAACHAPSSGVEQLQCYCPNTGTLYCGAGMLDAGGSLTAVANGLVAKVRTTTANPTAGSGVTLSDASLVVVDNAIVGWTWTLVDGGGIVASLGANTGSGITVTPTAAGTFRVRLAVVGDLGGRAGADQTVTVAAAPATTPSSRGGGAASGAWVAGVALAAAVLMGLRGLPGLDCLRVRRRRT
jgi:serine protease